MASALLGAVCLALGHHLFYASLSGQVVPTGVYSFAGTTLQKQQFNTSVGTAFAFLIKALLAFAISVAYLQIFWSTVKRIKQNPTVGELDWASGGLSNVFFLFYVKLWWKYPTLTVLAVTFWWVAMESQKMPMSDKYFFASRCMPIATIFTPGTLSIQQTFATRHEMHEVPQFDFTTFNYASSILLIGAGPPSNWSWHGPSQPVQHIALSVMGLGDILQIPNQFSSANASWMLNFSAPALRCSDVPGTKRDDVWTNIWNAYSIKKSSYIYLSWIPWGLGLQGNGSVPDLPFLTTSSPDTPLYDGPPPLSALDGPASMLVATLPSSRNLSIFHDTTSKEQLFFWKDRYGDHGENGNGGCRHKVVRSIRESLPGCVDLMNGHRTFIPAWAFEDATLLRCDLVNASYSTHFKYASGTQHVAVTPHAIHDAQIHANSILVGPSVDQSPNQSEVVTPYGVLPGGLEDCGTFQTVRDGLKNDTACFFDAEAVRGISYQSIMTAFNQLVLGAVTNAGGFGKYHTPVTRTILGQTRELAFLKHYSFDYMPSLQTYLIHNTDRAYQGLVNPHLPKSRGELKSVLEELFQNYTVSLLAEPYLRPSYSSQFAPPKLTDVTIQTFENVYRYDAMALWIAYGLSILVTLLTVVIGVVALFLNDASYSNNFSTMLRISRTAELSAEVKECDGSGKDPLPKYLKHASLNISTSAAKLKSRGNENKAAEKQGLMPVSRHTL